MKLTSKGRYAVMAMADLASNQNSKPVSLIDISLRQNISLSYLEQLFSKLKKIIELKYLDINRRVSIRAIINFIEIKKIN